MKCILALVTLAIAFSLVGCEADGQKDNMELSKLKVRELVLTDSKGQQRARIGLEAGQPSVLLFDDGGRIRLGFGLDNDGSPQIGLSNVAGIPVLNLAMDGEGNMGLLIVNEQGLPRVVTGVGSDGKARSDLYTDTGYKVFSATE